MVVIGIAVGALGTLIGAGGGFLVVPLLMLVFGASPAMAAGTSMVMVTVNSFVGTVAYVRQGKVDWRGGLFLSIAAFPGSLLGAWLGTRLPTKQFSLLFGALLLSLALWIIYQSLRKAAPRPAPSVATAAVAPGNGGDAAAAHAEEPVAADARGWRLCRQLVEAGGPVHAYCFVLPVGAVLSFVVGVVGGMLGIGGGPLMVPAMIYALHYPVHIAAATSQFIIALTSVGAATYYHSTGHVLMPQAVALSIGTVAGAPLGAWLSRKVNSRQLVMVLAVVLLVLGVRLLISGPSSH